MSRQSHQLTLVAIFVFGEERAMQDVNLWAEFEAYHAAMQRQEREEAPQRELEQALRPKKGRRNGPVVGWNPITRSVYVNHYAMSGWKPDERLSSEAQELLKARFAPCIHRSAA